MADVQKNVTTKDETGEKLVEINLCILVFHSILECSKLLQIQDAGFSFEAGGRTFYPVVFHSMSGTLISILEGCFIIL